MRPVLSRSRLSLIEQHARQMRSWLTPPEQALWSAINRRQLGVQFRRQVVVGRFSADFLAPAARLIVEVEGRHHEHQRSADARRERALVRAGYRVLRLEAELVLRDLAQAVARIPAALGELP